MSKIKLRNSKIIGDFCEPYIVAEVGTNHRGKKEKIYEMIDAAKAAGCSCVKFQSWTVDTLYSKIVYEKNPIAKRMVNSFSLNEEELLDAFSYCQKIGIDFSSTPYSTSEVDFLVEKCQAPYIKIASMDLNNYPFLDYVARKNVPIVLATGMSELSEIEKAVKTIEKTGNKQLCLLHCISIYPPKLETMNINNIIGLRKRFPQYPIGLSDHSLGIEVSVASMALGVCLIEKHLTMDKKAMGWDNDMAMEPDEFKNLVLCCKNVYKALGNEERVVEEEELKQRQKIRRSIVASKDLKKGTVLGLDDLDCKRPGTGLPPEKLMSLVGKTLGRDISYDELIFESDILN